MFAERQLLKMNIIEECKKNNWKICMYGLGNIGINYGKEFLEYLDISPDFFCDRNQEKLDMYPVDISKKIGLKNLKDTHIDMLVLLMIGFLHEDEVRKELSVNPKLHILTWGQICEREEVLKKFYGIERFPENGKRNREAVYNNAIGNKKRKKASKIAVYTCITGNYDKLLAPMYIDNNCDYYLLTDVPDNIPIENEQYYTRINIFDKIPKEITKSNEQNRYCKMHGYELFPDYRYSIYIDGNIQIIGPISEYTKLIGKCGLATRRHHCTSIVYSGIMRIMVRGVIKRSEAIAAGNWLIAHGMPLCKNHFLCSVIICDHDNRIAINILNQWFEYYMSNPVKRDQFYLPYVLWEMGIKDEDVGVITNTVWNDQYVAMAEIHKHLND